MLYKIIHDKDTFELNPEIKAIAEFADLTDRQFRFVALVADRRTPLRSLPDKQRREKATMICGYGMEGNRPDKNARTLIAGQLEKVEKAILKYRELQWDEHQDTLDTVNAQIDEIKEYLKSDKKNTRDYGKALEQATKLGSKLPELVEAKQKLESLLNITVEQKPEITTYSSLDLPEEAIQDGAEELPAIEMYHKTQKKEG
jgi:hypothetical protein